MMIKLQVVLNLCYLIYAALYACWVRKMLCIIIRASELHHALQPLALEDPASAKCFVQLVLYYAAEVILKDEAYLCILRSVGFTRLISYSALYLRISSGRSICGGYTAS